METEKKSQEKKEPQKERKKRVSNRCGLVFAQLLLHDLGAKHILVKCSHRFLFSLSQSSSTCFCKKEGLRVRVGKEEGHPNSSAMVGGAAHWRRATSSCQLALVAPASTRDGGPGLACLWGRAGHLARAPDCHPTQSASPPNLLQPCQGGRRGQQGNCGLSPQMDREGAGGTCFSGLALAQLISSLME